MKGHSSCYFLPILAVPSTDDECNSDPTHRIAALLTFLLSSLAGSSSTSSVNGRMPMFVATIPNVTVTLGRDASLPCIVKDIGDYQVSLVCLFKYLLLTCSSQPFPR